ncbi:WD40 repeat domain-containing protein [Moorena sp. SIO4G3]|uniref:WD40 repeat domain-containing protein n=1 Tax=Moorena sp. SIO4G3 TaxID=2607821 RepID=UPI00142A79C1|nr:WD40 repeat domain-containing protein [Moorena sp. SIO4G3]NEO81521.1 WD40 repeat domain-containing protein [Moorena sp. SIO4G3]
MKIWDIEKSKCRIFSRENGHTRTVNSVCLSRDNHLGVSGSDDGTVKLWSVAVENCLNTFSEHTGKVLSVCMSSDNRFILSSSSESDKNLILRDLDRGKQIVAFTIIILLEMDLYQLPLLIIKNDRVFIQKTSKYTFLNGHDGAVNSVCLSFDSRVALSGGSDQTVKLWDIESGQCLSTFEGHTGDVTSVALSGDCRWAVSVAGDEIKLWFLDWELEERELTDWDEGARPYLETFLKQHPSYIVNHPQNNTGISPWTEQDFQYLLEDLGFVGYGWLRPEEVRRQLENMAGLNFQ